MTILTQEDVCKIVKDANIKFIRLWFTDILGFLKSFTISPSELEKAFDEGMGFDGSSIQGFCRIDESDMVAKPDPSTFCLLTWQSSQVGLARMFCDILNPDGTPYIGDPRYVLKRNLAKLAKLGYTMYVGPELEYFYFKNNYSTEFLDHGGYFDITPLDTTSNLRRDTIIALEKMDIAVEYSHHEVAPSQHEIDLRYQNALKMADSAMTYRLVVKEIAMRHGVYATFMPKPIFGQNGSGMHVHQSLFKAKKNIFFNENDIYGLSNEGKHYIAGLLKHAPEICSILAQWINSYKRLVPGYEAPVYIAWARRNRSCLVRVPMYKPGKEAATRCELRSPDPSANPYLSFSVMLAAGLKGIEKQYPLPAPIEEDIFKMTPRELKKNKIISMPRSLSEAIELTAKSSLVRECLGNHVFDQFVNNKRIEWDQFRLHVSQWELDRYLPIL